MIPDELCKPLLPSEFWLNYLKYNFYYSNGKIYKRNKGKPVGSLNDKGYRILTLGPLYNKDEKKKFRIHHVVWFLNFGEWPADEVDHIDRNRDNNGVENLRVVDRATNLANRKCSRSQDPF